jgi:hypothetical protein
MYQGPNRAPGPRRVSWGSATASSQLAAAFAVAEPLRAAAPRRDRRDPSHSSRKQDRLCVSLHFAGLRDRLALLLLLFFLVPPPQIERERERELRDGSERAFCSSRLPCPPDTHLGGLASLVAMVDGACLRCAPPLDRRRNTTRGGIPSCRRRRQACPRRRRPSARLSLAQTPPSPFPTKTNTGAASPPSCSAPSACSWSCPRRPTARRTASRCV